MQTGLASIPAVTLPLHAAGSGTLPAFLAHAAIDHGPIFRTVIPAGRDAGREVVFLVGPEANRFVLHTHRDHFSHDQGWSPIFGPAVGTGLLNMDDPAHAHHRRLWNPAFTTAALDAYLPAIRSSIVGRTATWLARGEVNLYDEVRWLTFDIAATVLAGLEEGAGLNRARDLFARLLHSNRRRGSRQLEQQRKTEARRELDELLLSHIAARRRIPPDEQPDDVLGRLVHACDAQGVPLTDDQIRGHLNILLVAGHETTTSFGTWALFLLATLPDHRARVRAELAEIATDGDVPFSPAALQALPWLDCFVREVGRLYPPVLNLPRGVVKPFLFLGHTVPAGTPVRLALAACHRLPHLFAEPEVFDPGRFAPPRVEDKRHPYALVTFGGGPRTCIGIGFAEIEMKALIAHVLLTYELDPVPEQHPIHAGFWVAKVPFGIRTYVTRRSGDSI